MKNQLLSLILILFSWAGFSQTMPYQSNTKQAKNDISKIIDAWHQAAGEANFEDYFSLMSEDAVFIGTDATENWQLEEFKAYAKPHFDKGRAWDFTSVERNIYIANKKGIAWFDELLDTHMGICRGSGVMQYIDGDWKISHYVLSIEIPNNNVAEITRIKKDFDTKMLQKLKAQN